MAIFFIIIPAALLVLALQHWSELVPKFEHPLWRSYTAFVAFCLSSVSVLLWVFMDVWALFRGGFPKYDPVLLRMYAFGALLGLAGFVTSLPGKGKLRWPVCFVSFAMLFMWFAAAVME